MDILDDSEIARYVAGNTEMLEALGIDGREGVALSRLGEGEHNVNYLMQLPEGADRAVLRVNVVKQPFHDDQVAYEFAALECLAPSGCTPRPLYHDGSPTAPGKGVLVISFCEGDVLDFDALRPGDLRCAAQLMADVHAVPVGPDCPLHRPADPLREFFEECVGRYKAYRASAFEDPRVTSWAEMFLSAASTELEKAPGAGDLAHIVNTEPLPSHFLIPARSAADAAAGGDGRLCARPGAFIDWERPIVGEVAQDLAYFTAPTSSYWDSEYLFEQDAVESFVEDYWRAVDGRFARGGFDRRFRAWRKIAALRAVAWCCRALVTVGTGARAHMTSKAARKLPVYLSDDFMELVYRECF